MQAGSTKCRLWREDDTIAWVVPAPPSRMDDCHHHHAWTVCCMRLRSIELRDIPSESFSKHKTVGGSRLFHEFAGPGFAQSWDRGHSIPKPRDQLVTTHRINNRT